MKAVVVRPRIVKAYKNKIWFMISVAENRQPCAGG
jgi:hypothetical protein